MTDPVMHLVFKWWSGPLVGAALAQAAELSGIDVLSVESEIFHRGRARWELQLPGTRCPDFVGKSTTTVICAEIRAGMSKGIRVLHKGSFARLRRDRYEQFVGEAQQATAMAGRWGLASEFWLIVACESIAPELPAQIKRESGADRVAVIRLGRGAPPHVAHVAGVPEWPLRDSFDRCAAEVWGMCETWNADLMARGKDCRSVVDLERLYEEFVGAHFPVPAAALKRQNLFSGWSFAMQATRRQDDGRKEVMADSLPDRKKDARGGNVWGSLQRLEGRDVPLLSQAKSIRVLRVGTRSVTVEKSTGNSADIARELIERVHRHLMQRGSVTRAEVLEIIGRQRHSSSICALLAQVLGVDHASHPVRLWLRSGRAGDGSGRCRMTPR